MSERTVCRVHEDTIEQFAMDRLKGSALARFERHVLLCGDCQDRVEQADLYVAAMRNTLRAIEIGKTGAERRTESRRACKRHVHVRVAGTRRPVAAQATDMSKSGFGLTLGVRMLAGARVLVAMGARQYNGEVAWCAPKGELYRVGVRLMAAA